MLRILSALAALALSAQPFMAQDIQFTQSQPLVVVELFTSQGCSSCPPADEILTELAAHKDVLPLALHVDYWDYIGWADTFANPAFTTRQKGYSHQAGSRTIYTPQFVIGGATHVIGVHPMEIADQIAAQKQSDNQTTLTLNNIGDQLSITGTSGQAFDQPANVQLVRYRPTEVVSIGRGENAGATITYTNIVTSWQIIGTWDGSAPLSLQANVVGPQSIAVIIQPKGPGPIIVAAALQP
jgi:hypothetical protein